MKVVGIVIDYDLERKSTRSPQNMVWILNVSFGAILYGSFLWFTMIRDIMPA